jgi:hypothetical protein
MRSTTMDAREPTAGDLAKARTEQERGGDDDKVARRTESWQEQAEQIESDMSDAVERAQAMGDHVEPSLLPQERRPDETPAEDRDSVGDPDSIGYDRSSGDAEQP